MVSKGKWEKTKDEENWIIWEKEGSSSYDYKSISVAKMYSDKIINNNIKGKFSWVVRTGDNINSDYEVFKSKSEAISYARKYMSKN
jgi:hypothetical protein